jgi:hypothetical protein
LQTMRAPGMSGDALLDAIGDVAATVTPRTVKK